MQRKILETHIGSRIGVALISSVKHCDVKNRTPRSGTPAATSHLPACKMAPCELSAKAD